MKTGTDPEVSFGKTSKFSRLSSVDTTRGGVLILTGVLLMALIGCETPPSPPPAANTHSETGATANEEVQTLKQGDVLKIGFPGVPTMDTTQAIRPDGRLSLPMVGDHVVAGKTIDALSKELLDLYANKLVSKEVTVSVVSSAYTVYITGAVLRPGKIVAERRITVFDAIMEAGGFDKAKADLKAVVVIRAENGQNQRYTLDLQKMFSGEATELFYLKPFDTVYVPEKFNWF